MLRVLNNKLGSGGGALAPETAKTHKHEFNTLISNYIMFISI